MLICDAISVTTAADGSATVYSSRRFSGRVIALIYDGGLDAGADLTITLENTGQAVLTKANAGAATYRPLQTMQDAADGSDLVISDYIHAVDERLKIVVAQGGNAQTGEVKLIYDGYNIAS